MKDIEIKELEKCECVSSVMTIAPVLNIEREKMGNLGILLKIDDGVYVCICTVYTAILKHFTQHAFFHDSHFSTKYKSECCGEIIDNRSYAPICVLEEKDRKSKNTLMMTGVFFSQKKLERYTIQNIIIIIQIDIML